jgi:AcrR family transcriptional regulator
MASERPYHHGNLRAALLAAAAAEIAEVGTAAMSLRRVAGRAGVSHTAAAHHFGDKRGLLTALAAEGHRALAEALAAARPGGRLALGEAYLRFAHDHRPWFEVMFRPELLRTDDPELVEASRSSFGELRATSRTGGGTGDDLAYGAWGLVHGLAVLWLSGNLPVATVEEAQALLRRSARALARGQS